MSVCMCACEYASLWLKRLCRNLFCTPCSVHSSDRARSSSFDGNLQPKFNETLGTCSLAEVIGSVLSLQTKSKIGKQRKLENHWKGKTPFNKEESTIQAVTMALNHCVILNNSLPCWRHQWTNTAGENWQNKTRKSCISREPQFPLMRHSFPSMSAEMWSIWQIWRLVDYNAWQFKGDIRYAFQTIVNEKEYKHACLLTKIYPN